MAQPDRERRSATYDDLRTVPDHLVAEILDGELYATPRPSPRHADASSGLGAALRQPFDRGRGGPGGWRILFEPEWHLGDDVVVPDIAGWRRERLPQLPDDAYFALAPDWICEVLSPSTVAIDRVRSSRFTHASTLHTRGSSIRLPERSKYSGWRQDAGPSSQRTPAPTSCVRSRSTRSIST